MSKKKKDSVIEDYQKLKNEIMVEKVDEIFRTQPDNYISALEEIGFTYYDDDDDEEMEEANAKPEIFQKSQSKFKISHLTWSRSLSGQCRSFVGSGLFP
jgi:hypothetical protein